MSLTRKNENTVNLKSVSFVVIMLLHKGLTRVHSQKKPRSHFGRVCFKSLYSFEHSSFSYWPPPHVNLLSSTKRSWLSLVFKHTSRLCFAKHATPPIRLSPQPVSSCIVPSGHCLVNCSKQRETLKLLSRKIILHSFVYCQRFGLKRHWERWGFGGKIDRWHGETQTKTGGDERENEGDIRYRKRVKMKG